VEVVKMDVDLDEPGQFYSVAYNWSLAFRQNNYVVYYKESEVN